jgi:manganese oxidase
MGMQLVGTIQSDGSWVGENNSSLILPDEDRTITYRFQAEKEGAFLAYSTAADFGPGSDAGQLSAGLFGSVTVHPRGAEWYRSQVTRADMDLATKGKTADGQPIVDYAKLYPDGAKYPDGTAVPANTPVLRMLNSDGEIVHSDLTAIITGKDAGAFPKDTFSEIDVLPDRYQPYREFAIHYHDASTLMQAFSVFITNMASPELVKTLAAGKDAFAINYGAAGIGAEIWANRIGVGPMHNSIDAKFEEFFLSSWVVGDPAMVVDVPANAPSTPSSATSLNRPVCLTDPPVPGKPPRSGPKATKAFYPDDPSNVYHSYLHDHVKFRIIHAGGNVTHVHHQHAHQWLRAPDSDTSTLLDSQMITPGDAFTLEMIYGSGNRNMTPGDSIFHCHFYPHFAAGMWSLWRVHDVFESGTELDGDGRPKEKARALPDGEITRGTPIPAIVPLPTLPMAPTPAAIQLVAAKDPLGTLTGGTKVEVVDADSKKNPGYPFFIPGVSGRRAPHPPYDFAEENNETLDGGLPRHLVLNGDVVYHKENKWDFSKENVHTVNGISSGKIVAIELPEKGTDDELRAIKYHKEGDHPSFTPENRAGNFLTNGTGPLPGAPLANPAITPDGKLIDAEKIVYKVADIQLDVVFNKKGWHFPQQRISALWGDVGPLVQGPRRLNPSSSGPIADRSSSTGSPT